jgi:hypothetical protein
MRPVPRTLVAIAALACAQGGGAYELLTHAVITHDAYVNSNLATDNSVIARLGLGARVWGPVGPIDKAMIGNLAAGGTYTVSTTPFGNYYWDYNNVDRAARITQGQFEQSIIETCYPLFAVDPPAALTLPDWLMRGAIREDDYLTTATAVALGVHAADNPQTPDTGGDPIAEFTRPCNHFYDPLNDVPLTYNLPLIGQVAACTNYGDPVIRESPAWAIGVADPYALPTTPLPEPLSAGSSRNHFSIANAVAAEWTALTGMDSSGNQIAPNPQDKDPYWATMFRSLGDAMHLIEDMAQPQHTRNEPHSGLFWNTGLLGGHTSVIEKHTEGRVAAYCRYVNNPTSSPAATLPFSEAPPYSPSFTSYLQFWTSRSTAGPGGGGASLAGSGLADYSNHGFFSAANNFGDGKFTNPPSSFGSYTPEIVSSLDYYGGSYVSQYLRGTVQDNYLGLYQPTSPNGTTIRMTLYSSWSSMEGGDQMFALDDSIYDQQVSLLIPRAIGYASGLLNYYFRGQLAITPPAAGVYGVVDHSQASTPSVSGFQNIRLRLQNTTPPIVLADGSMVSQDMVDNTFNAAHPSQLVLVVKYHVNDKCYAGNMATYPDLTGEPGIPGNSLAGCRGDDELTAVSSSTIEYNSVGEIVDPISLPADGSVHEFQFSFPTVGGIPVNATDISFQVVYRGPLGTDGDAVVVATKDILSPSYFSLFNVTDLMVCIGSTWYKNVLGGGLSDSAQNAIISLGGNPATAGLAPSPYAQASVRFDYDANRATTQPNPLLSVTNLLPDQYVSAAVLVDDQQNYSFNIVGYTFPGTFPITFSSEQYGLSFPTPTPVLYESTLSNKVRSVNVWGSTFGYKFFGTDCTNTPDTPQDNSDDNGKPFPQPTLVPFTTISF